MSMTHHLWAIIDPTTMLVTLRVTEGYIPTWKNDNVGIWVHIKGFRLKRPKR